MVDEGSNLRCCFNLIHLYMSIQKLTADFIFDGERLRKNAVLIIQNDGLIVDCIEAPDNEMSQNAEYHSGILSPGFVNAHCHLELSHLHKKIPEHTGLVNFLLHVIQQRETPLDDIQAAAVAADKYMYDEGIVAVGDICNTDHTIPIKKNSNIYYHNFIEVMGFDPATAQQRLASAMLTQKAFHDNGLPASIAPHAPYSVSKGLFKLIDALPQSSLSIHNQETEEENIFFQEKKGDFLRLYQTLQIPITHFEASQKTSLQTYFPWLITPRNVILVHNVATSLKEIQMICNDDKHDFYLCICANANQYINEKMPSLKHYIDSCGRMVIGTDSLASNHQLSVLEELKTIQKYYPSISLEKLLQWSTYNGAKALQIDDRFGSFSKGKKPGVIQIAAVLNNNIEQAFVNHIV